jgi:hypothetical protein
VSIWAFAFSTKRLAADQIQQQGGLVELAKLPSQFEDQSGMVVGERECIEYPLAGRAIAVQVQQCR